MIQPGTKEPRDAGSVEGLNFRPKKVDESWITETSGRKDGYPRKFTEFHQGLERDSSVLV